MSAIKGNPALDFAEQNPIIAQVSAFKHVYKKHKPDIASKMCWSMFMIEEADYNFNVYARIIDRDDRVEEVQKAYYKIDIESEEYKMLASDYSKFVLSVEESLYNIHVTKFQELTTHLNTLTLTTESDYKQYMEIMKSLPSMWKGLEIVREQMIDSQSKNKVRGNAQLSAREKRKNK